MSRYVTLNDAMAARDDLAEAEIRYRLLAETFEASPNLRANLNPALERAKAEILRLRAMAAAKPSAGGTGESAQVIALRGAVAFDPNRFRRTAEVNE